MQPLSKLKGNPYRAIEIMTNLPRECCDEDPALEDREAVTSDTQT